MEQTSHKIPISSNQLAAKLQNDFDAKYDASNPAAYITQVEVDTAIAAVINGAETGGTFDNPANGQPVTGGGT